MIKQILSPHKMYKIIKKATHTKESVLEESNKTLNLLGCTETMEQNKHTSLVDRAMKCLATADFCNEKDSNNLELQCNIVT